MLQEAKRLHGVTEAQGSYNRHGTPQGAGGALARSIIEAAAHAVAIDAGPEPIVIADYGSSQGKNSLTPVRSAIIAFRQRLAPHRSIGVVHIDVPENDFGALLALLDTSHESYLLGDDDVFPSIVGRSFYRSVLPPAHVHLGWSGYAAGWLSHTPTLIPDHCWIPGSTGEVRQAFERQAAQDWERFLRLRARELRPGGRFVVALPGSPDDDPSSPKWRLATMMNHINEILSEFVADQTMTPEERTQMVIPAYARRKDELLAPFVAEGRFEGLTVERCDVLSGTDPAWEKFEQDGDNAALAAAQVAFYRATFMPTLASALGPQRSAEARKLFVDRLAGELGKRLIGDPAPMQVLPQVIVLAKGAEV